MKTMKGSYVQHSADTKEFSEGATAASRGESQWSNPYPDGKQHLDWAIGYEAKGVVEIEQSFVKTSWLWDKLKSLLPISF